MTSPLSAALAAVPVAPERDEARRWLLDELSDPVYDAQQPGLLERVIARVLGWLSSLEVPEGPGASALLVGAVVLVVVLVALALATAGPLRRRARSAAAGEVFAGTALTADQHRARSEDAARQGRWTEAVTERFRAVARSLEERVVLDVRPGRTAQEVARDASPALPQVAGPLAEGARLFDDVVYGDRPAGPPAYQRLRDLDDLVAGTRPTSPVAADLGPDLAVPR